MATKTTKPVNEYIKALNDLSNILKKDDTAIAWRGPYAVEYVLELIAELKTKHLVK